MHRLRTVVNPVLSSQFSVLSSQCCGAIVKRRAARLRQPTFRKTVLVVSIRPHCVRACTFKPTTRTELVHSSDNYIPPVACIEPRMRSSHDESHFLSVFLRTVDCVVCPERTPNFHKPGCCFPVQVFTRADSMHATTRGPIPLVGSRRMQQSRCPLW